MNSRLQSKLICAIIPLLITFSLSCKKSESKIEDTEPDKPAPVTRIVIENTTSAPAEIIQFTIAENAAAQQQVTGKLGTEEVKVVINQNIAYVMMPGLADGNYELSFTSGGKNYTGAVQLKAVANVKTADFYASGFQDSIATFISRLERVAESSTATSIQKQDAARDAGTYSAALKDFNEQYQKLPASGKLEFAQFMAVHKPVVDELVQANLEMTSAFAQLQEISRLKQQQSIGIVSSGKISSARTSSTAGILNSKIFDLEEAQKEAITRWLKSSYVMSRNIAKLAGVLYAGPVIAGAVPVLGTLAVGIAAGYLIIQVAESVSVNLTAMNDLIDQVLLPYEGLTLSHLSTSATVDLFENQQVKSGNGIATYKLFDQSDNTSPSTGSFIKDFLGKMVEYRTSIGNFLEKIPARFKPAVKLRTLAEAIQKRVKPVHNKYVKIDNVSNPQVTFTVEELSDGTYKITANTQEKTDQSFTYDITYSNTDFSAKGLKKTISAKVKADVDSIALYKAAIVGDWINTWYGGGYDNTRDKYHLNAFGTGQRTYTSDANRGSDIPDGDYYNTLTWSVSKIGNDYYLYMPFNNRNIAFGGKLTGYPNLQVKSFPVYGSTSIYTIMKRQ